jgi:hypothetical protein
VTEYNTLLPERPQASLLPLAPYANEAPSKSAFFEIAKWFPIDSLAMGSRFEVAFNNIYDCTAS